MIPYKDQKVRITYLIFITGIIILLIGNFSFSLQKTRKPFQPLLQANDIQIQSQTKKGSYYTIHAQAVQEGSNKSSYQFTNMHAITYWDSKKKVPSYILKAPQASLDQQKNTINFLKDVQVLAFQSTGEQIRSVTTSQAIFNLKTHSILSTGHTIEQTKNHITHSDQGIRTLDNNQKIFLLGHVHVKFTKSNTTLTANHYLYVNTKQHFYYATKNPTLTYHGIHIQANQYLACLLNKWLVTTAFAQSHVQIFNSQIKAFASSLIYKKNIKKFFLWGAYRKLNPFDTFEPFVPEKSTSARIVQHDITFSSNKFIIYLKFNPMHHLWNIRNIKALGHVIAKNTNKHIMLTGETGYYNLITHKLMICGHARVISNKVLLRGACIESNLRSGVSRVIKKTHTKRQVEMLIFQ